MTDPGEFTKGKKGSRVVKRHLNGSEMFPPFSFLETKTNSVTHGGHGRTVQHGGGLLAPLPALF